MFVVWTGNLWLLLGLAVDLRSSTYRNTSYRCVLAQAQRAQANQRSKTYRKDDGVGRSDPVRTVVGVTLIRIYRCSACIVIPTPSMEKSLLVGDYLLVSKLAYGPVMPNTPLSFPLVHNTMPLSQTKKSFVEWIKWPYHRLSGMRARQAQRSGRVQLSGRRHGDADDPSASYYDLLRQFQQAYGEKTRTRHAVAADRDRRTVRSTSATTT
ncbi:MAG: hypothetical protein ACLTZY_03720 [Alistipes indistinctus]